MTDTTQSCERQASYKMSFKEHSMQKKRKTYIYIYDICTYIDLHLSKSTHT